MLTLSEVLRDSGISYQTLVKYTQLGLVPKPKRVWGGRGRGSQSLYPDDVIETIHRVKLRQQTGLTLAQIAEELRQEREPRRTDETRSRVLVPENPQLMRSYIKTTPELYEQVERENPGYRLHTIRMVSVGRENERSLVPVELVIVPKE